MHIVVDLETMSTAPDAAIVSIGAVHINLDAMKVDLPVWYGTVDLSSSMAYGGRVDGSTIMWWLGQSEIARKTLSVTPVGLELALQSLRTWMLRWGSEKELRMWGYGADFDCSILANAFRSVSMPPPWEYRHARCLRTLKAVLRDKLANIQYIGVAHNALDDAMHQGNVLIECAKVLGGRIG